MSLRYDGIREPHSTDHAGLNSFSDRTSLAVLCPGRSSNLTTTSQDELARLWTRDFVLNLLVAHCIFASYTAMFTLIPLYVVGRGGAETGSFG